MKFITDLKIIARNTYIYNSNNNSNSKNSFNMNSKIISNNEKYKIISENKEQLVNNDIFNKIYNNSTNKFDYINFYSNLYGNESNNNLILNKMQREHEELNYLNYINYTNYTNIDNLTEEETKKLKFILSILKSIYLKEFLSKKSSMNLLNILIFSEKELIIYPPEVHESLNLYHYYYSKYIFINDNRTYPSCIYDDNINSFLEKYIITINEYINFDEVFASICIKFPFIKEKPDKSMLCFEIEINSAIKSLNF